MAAKAAGRSARSHSRRDGRAEGDVEQAARLAAAAQKDGATVVAHPLAVVQQVGDQAAKDGGGRRAGRDGRRAADPGGEAAGPEEPPGRGGDRVAVGHERPERAEKADAGAELAEPGLGLGQAVLHQPGVADGAGRLEIARGEAPERQAGGHAEGNGLGDEQLPRGVGAVAGVGIHAHGAQRAHAVVVAQGFDVDAGEAREGPDGQQPEAAEDFA